MIALVAITFTTEKFNEFEVEYRKMAREVSKQGRQKL